MSVENSCGKDTVIVAAEVLETCVGAIGILDIAIPGLVNYVSYSNESTFIAKLMDKLNDSLPDPVGWTIGNILSVTNEVGINPNITLGIILLISTVLIADGTRRLMGEFSK